MGLARAAMSPTVAFGHVLRRLRLARGLSQEKLQDKAHVTQEFISALERGKNTPSLETIFKLASALELSASALVAMTEKEKAPD